VKREFARPGAVMGLYSASLNLGAAAAAAVTVPLADALGIGWRAALGMWLALALAALALWLPVAGTGAHHRRSGPPPDGPGSWALLRQPLAVQVTGYIGLQSSPTREFRCTRVGCCSAWRTWWVREPPCWRPRRPAGCAPSDR
jgi:CP family cyanate transporter-like MFS transporter